MQTNRKKLSRTLMNKLALGTLLLSAGCGTAAPVGTSQQNALAAAPVQASVFMQNKTFSQASLTVPVGSTVTWTNKDTPSHDIAIDKGPELWLSAERKPGQSASFTFTRPGKYHYVCEFHPIMQAEVLVTDASGKVPDAIPAVSTTFKETGKTVRGKFLDYWNTHGGLAQQGFPISEEMQEKSPTDGKIYTVQYFERAVFEYHPENKPPYDILLSLLGNFYYKQKYPNGAPNQTANASSGSVQFKETGKHLGGVFLQYWNTHGGLAQQGFPISEEFNEKSDLNGQTYKVQYFERAVFESHPENKPPYDVLLSQLGTFQYKQTSANAPKPQPGIWASGISSGAEHYPLLSGPHAAPGVNVWIYDQDPTPVVNWVKDLGVKWVLHQLSWYHIEPQKGVYKWELLDRAIDALNAAGVKIILNPVHSPTWASDISPGFPNNPDDFARFMTAVAQRYKGKVAGYQIWNEPNLARESGTYVVATRYAELLKAGYKAVKAVDPQAIVITAALTPTGVNNTSIAIDDVEFLKRLYAYNGGEIRGYFDALGGHPGSNANPPETLYPENPGPGPGWNNHPSFYFRRIEQLRQVMIDNGDAEKQMWLTEFGWASTPNPAEGFGYAAQNTEQEQADYITRAFHMGRDRYPWMGGMLLFGLNFSLPNVSTDPTDERIAWSILRRDGSKRPSYFAVKDYAAGK